MAWVKSSKVMPQLPAIYLFSWEREGNSYASNPIETFKKILQSAFSDQKPLQHTSLDLQCVCDALQNCPIVQNYMYILSTNFTPFQ